MDKGDDILINYLFISRCNTTILVLERLLIVLIQSLKDFIHSCFGNNETLKKTILSRYYQGGMMCFWHLNIAIVSKVYLDHNLYATTCIHPTQKQQF